jgi:non-ribosomal peptide synthetase component E (peptide arylation enzyme)
MTMTPTGVLYDFAKALPNNVAFIKDKQIWTYERLATEVDRLARGLIEHGVRKGDRVALHMANLAELVVAYHACLGEQIINGSVFSLGMKEADRNNSHASHRAFS